jgi:ribonuclease P protein component
VLGNAVERNRIKRRMRAAVRENLALLIADVDVVLHPKRSVLEAEFSVLTAELRRIFLRIQREMGPREMRPREMGPREMGLRGMGPRETELPAATASSPESPTSRSTAGPSSQSTAESASVPGARS